MTTIFGQVSDTQSQTNLILNNMYNLVVNELSQLNERRNIIKEVALTLFTNTNFEVDKRAPIQIAKDCIAKALLMTKEIKDQKIIN